MKLPRPTLTGVLAMLALCLVVSGTAYAAGALPKNSVGAKQIKTNAVRSPDIKNGAVKLADLNPEVVTAFTPTPPSLPKAYQVSDSSIQFVGTSPGTFATLDIPESGDYLVTANLRVFPRAGNPGDGLFCTISGGSGLISIVNHGVTMPSGVAQATMHGILGDVPGGTTLELECNTLSKEITLTYDWTAVQVDLQ